MRACRLLLPLFLALPALAQVVVTAPKDTLQPGEQLQFTATVDGRPGIDVLWTVEEPAGLTAPGGLLSAPFVDRPTVVRVRAWHGQVKGDASVRVEPILPPDLGQLVQGFLPQGQWETDKPYLDLETGERFGPPCDVHVVGPPRTRTPQVIGYGMGGAIRENPAPSGSVFVAKSFLLSYREGEHVIRQEDQSQWRSTPFPMPSKALITSCQVEGLWKIEEYGRTWWESRTVHVPVTIRGLVPLAGNPLAAPGHEAGWTVSARLTAPCGLAVWKGRPNPADPPLLAVADPGDDTLRRLTLDGVCADLAGLPGHPGYLDGKGRAAFFNGPTFMAAWAHGPHAHPERLLVADSGNHVIRVVDADSNVTTLAGTPTLAGHHDAGNPREAQFNDPRGLAVDAHGNIYVADHGNYVIRRIDHRTRAVTTVAGSPGLAGATDHPALFRDLKGLCFDDHGELLIADGAAIRVIPDLGHPGAVTTIFGQVDRRGFQGIPPGSPEKGLLDDPWGLAYDPGKGRLYIADRGNQCVWAGNLRAPGHGRWRGPELWPQLGDRDRPATGWGLLRDGIPGPLPEGFAILEGPQGVAFLPGDFIRELAVSTGRCVALAGDIDSDPRVDVSLNLRVAEEVQAGADVPVNYDYRYGKALAGHDLRLRFLDAATGRPVAPGLYRRIPDGTPSPGYDTTFPDPGEVIVEVISTNQLGESVSARKVVKVKARR